MTKDVLQILWDDRVFHMREPIDLTIRHRGPYYFVGFEPLGIEGYGHDKQEALESFADVFSATWDWIVRAKTSQLGNDAQNLKQRLRELVERVETRKRTTRPRSQVEPAA